MNLNENLLRMFAKAVNTTTEKETKMYYGTITDIQETDGVRVPYVHLDGSQPDSKTPLVEGTEVMEGDRVIVTIENHKAVVMSNITSPASARTAKSYMDLFPEGLVIGEIDNDPDDIDFNVLIKPDGMYIRYGVEPIDPTDPNSLAPVILARYTVNGVVLGQNDEIVIRAASDVTTVERFNSTTFTLSKDNISRIISVVGDVCIDTDTGDIVNDVAISSTDYSLIGNSMTISSPLTGTYIEPQSVIVTYAFTDKPIGTISIGSNSVISDQYPLVIGNNNLNKAASNIFSVDWSGRVKAAGGCNARVIWVEKKVTGLSVPAGVGTNYTTQVNIPAGYTPCGLTAFKIMNHINSDVLNSVDLNVDGSINYCIMNRGTNNWTDEVAYFQVACILTS